MANLALAFDILARDKASKNVDNVGDAFERTGKKSAKFKAVAAAALLGGAAAIVKFGRDSVEAFADAQQSAARLDAAYAKFPRTNDVTRKSFDTLNSALERKTKFDDDAIASGQSVLAQFKLTGTQIQQLTPLLTDYAAKTGRDIPTAAQDLGKAVLGQGRALKTVGLNLKDTGSATGNLNQLMGGLRKQVGGFAEQQGKTAAGQAAILSNEFGEVQETVGSKLVPVLTQLAGVLLKVIDFVQRNSSVLVPLGGAVLAIVAAVKAWNVVQKILDAELLANPIGLVVVALAGLVTGLVIAYKRSETFRNIVNGVFGAVGKAATFLWEDAIRPAFKFIADLWFTVVGALVNGAASAFGWVPGLGGKLKGAAKKFNEFRDEVNAALSGIQDRHVQVSADLKLNKLATLNLHAVAPGTIGSARAYGGPVYPGRVYTVGEFRRELFVPSQAGRILPRTPDSYASDDTTALLTEQRRTNQLLEALAGQDLVLRLNEREFARASRSALTANGRAL